jgi:DNA modification methylase
MIIEGLQPLATEIDKLKLLPGNPRKGDIQAVARSLEAFGQRKPIVAISDGTVIAGNHTLQAAQSLGWEKIAVVFVEDDEAKAKAYALADNRTAELGGYDNQALVDLISDVQLLDKELFAATGWENDDLAELIATLELEQLPTAFTDPDDIPDIPFPKTIEGDIWLLGPHRVLCGSATEPTDIQKVLAGELAACVFTDPPYNVAYEGGTSEKLTIANDDMSDAEFDTFLFDAFTSMRQGLQPGGAIYVCHADGSGNAFRNAYVRSGLLLKQVLIWVKNQFVLGRQDYNWQHEPILYGWNPGAAHNWYGPFNRSTIIDDAIDFEKLNKNELLQLIVEIREQSTVIREDRPKRNKEHPTMKPVDLITRLIVNNTRVADIVLDPFGGSGSTLIAAHQIGRRACLIELDPKYVDVICKRWQEHTGIKPINEATNQEHDFLEA